MENFNFMTKWGMSRLKGKKESAPIVVESLLDLEEEFSFQGASPTHMPRRGLRRHLQKMRVVVVVYVFLVKTPRRKLRRLAMSGQFRFVGSLLTSFYSSLENNKVEVEANSPEASVKVATKIVVETHQKLVEMVRGTEEVAVSSTSESRVNLEEGQPFMSETSGAGKGDKDNARVEREVESDDDMDVKDEELLERDSMIY
ncbi:hypothetical protein ACFE04_012120 [Oxalis oulophora]